MKITNRAAEGYSTGAILLLDRAEGANDLLDYAAAESLYSEVIDEFPLPPFAYAKRGYARSKLGKFALAVEDFGSAISRKPNSPVTIWQRALAYEALGKLDLALNDYSLFLQFNGGDDEAYLAIGMIYEYRGDISRALDFYRDAIRVCPTNKEAQFRIEKLTQLGGSEEARA